MSLNPLSRWLCVQGLGFAGFEGHSAFQHSVLPSAAASLRVSLQTLEVLHDGPAMVTSLRLSAAGIPWKDAGV